MTSVAAMLKQLGQGATPGPWETTYEGIRTPEPEYLLIAETDRAEDARLIVALVNARGEITAVIQAAEEPTWDGNCRLCGHWLEAKRPHADDCALARLRATLETRT